MPTDRSMDMLLKVRDLPGIQVGNWQDWKLEGLETVILSHTSISESASQTDTVMCNLTKQELIDQAQEEPVYKGEDEYMAVEETL